MDCESQCFWESLSKDIKKHISQCVTCIRAKHSHNKKVVEGHLKLPPRSGHTFAIDIVGSLPKSGVFSKILVVVCTYSRYTRAVPLCTGTGTEVIKRLKEIFSYFGRPVCLISDNAGAFVSQEFSAYLQSHNISHHLTTPYAPQGNALAERTIRSVLSLLRVLSNDRPGVWHSYLPKVCDAINEGFNLTLKERPYFLFYNRDPNPNFNVLRDESFPSSDEAFAVSKYAYQLVERELSKDHLRKDKQQLASGRITSYEVGDIVYLQRHFVGEKAYKIKHLYIGPFRIEQVKGNTTKLLNLGTGKERQASMRNIKLFKAENLNRNSNPNVGRIFPTKEPRDIDEDLMSETSHEKQGEETPVLKKRYNLRSREQKIE